MESRMKILIIIQVIMIKYIYEIMFQSLITY
jgi:hypothetical protein